VVCAQVVSAYREVVNSLNLDGVVEKWADVLDQLDKFEKEIGCDKYFGGEKICLFLLRPAFWFLPLRQITCIRSVYFSR